MGLTMAGLPLGRRPFESGRAAGARLWPRKEISMRKLLWIVLVPVVAILPALLAPVRGQTPIQPQMLYARQRQINIPFDPDPAEAHRLKQLQLYYSTDQGRSWHLGATAAPDQKRFNFIAEGDGLYWFAVQTTDLQNRNYPDKLEALAPALRVSFDTVPPVVNLKALPPRGNEVGVTWDVRDDHFDANQPGAIKLEYRAAGAAAWTPLSRPAGAITHYWAPGTTGLLEVRIRATDLAGNSTEATTQVSLNQGGFGNAGVHAGDGREPPGAAPADATRQYLNSKRITLNYEIIEKGPSGISAIDLWFTRDGRSWSKFQLPKNAVNDAGFNDGPLTFDVEGEGVYGFTLLPKSGVGLSQPPPQVGERPQIWIEVDLTKPVVELQSVLVGQGEHKGKLSISWLARDKNLGKAPITLSYSNSSNGPWTTFANQLANTGRHIWTMPPGINWQFYLKVEAVDLAGNVGEAITPGLVKVDLQQPKAKITGAQGGAN
jgi:hypothetical protein